MPRKCHLPNLRTSADNVGNRRGQPPGPCPPFGLWGPVDSWVGLLSAHAPPVSNALRVCLLRVQSAPSGQWGQRNGACIPWVQLDPILNTEAIHTIGRARGAECKGVTAQSVCNGVPDCHGPSALPLPPLLSQGGVTGGAPVSCICSVCPGSGGVYCCGALLGPFLRRWSDCSDLGNSDARPFPPLPSSPSNPVQPWPVFWRTPLLVVWGSWALLLGLHVRQLTKYLWPNLGVGFWSCEGVHMGSGTGALVSHPPWVSTTAFAGCSASVTRSTRAPAAPAASSWIVLPPPLGLAWPCPTPPPYQPVPCPLGVLSPGCWSGLAPPIPAVTPIPAFPVSASCAWYPSESGCLPSKKPWLAPTP